LTASKFRNIKKKNDQSEYENATLERKYLKLVGTDVFFKMTA
jgi:hypothetical protein